MKFSFERRVLFVKLVLALVVGASCAASLALAMAKLDSLAFHTRDFPYYLQLAARFLDPRLSDQYQVSTLGVNFLGFGLLDAGISMHHSVHFEPLKYLYPLLYQATHSPTALLFATAIAYYLPALYVIAIFPVRAHLDWLVLALVVLLYCVYPSSIHSASADLRPISLMGPLFLALLLALLVGRPQWEILLLFNGLFLCREEALVLGFIAVLVAAARARASAERARLAWLMAGCWLVWSVVILAYYRLAGFDNLILNDLLSGAMAQRAMVFVALAITFALMLAGLVWIVRRQRVPPDALPAVVMLIFALPLLGQYYSLFRLNEDWRTFIANHIHSTPYLFVLLGLALAVWHMRRPRLTAVVASTLGAVLVFAGASLAWGEDSPWQTYVRARGDAPFAEVLFELRAQLDAHDTIVLTDLDSYQVFYAFENAYAFDRVPVRLLAPEVRARPEEHWAYPANAATVQHLLEHDVDVIAIRHTNEATLLELVAKLNLQERLLLLVENPHYVAYQVLRDDEVHYERWRVDFGDVIRAQDHVIRRSGSDSRQFDLTLTVQSLAEMATNYNFRARLVDAAGTIWSEDQGWPWNAPTSAWPLLERRYDHRKLVLPPDAPAGLYAIELSLVDPETHDVATVTDVATGESLGTAWRLDYFQIGTPENAAPLADGREYVFGDALALVGADLPVELLPGEPVEVRLGWLAHKSVDQDYTVFVHLIDGDGNVVAQHDKPPLDGFYPTSHWIPDRPVIDSYMLQLPEALPPGPYRLHVGFYLPESGQRLAVSGGDESTHDEAVLQIPDGTAQ